MWYNDISPSLGEGGNSYFVSLTYMLESRDHKCWIATKRKEKTNFHLIWYKLKTSHLLKLISFTGQVKMTTESRIKSANFFTYEAPGVNSAQIIYVHTWGAKCREWEHSRDLHGRALMTDHWLLQHFDNMCQWFISTMRRKRWTHDSVHGLKETFCTVLDLKYKRK